ncbi:OmpW family protein [Pandoraea terrae]|uniref:OmpW family protein n=1 Tax=Pandoraea terrae TaxID=1537710 RepID=A0A5E4YYT4_9BURK|nr:OmpW family outer membrane protein [Pandoraea terrae]VVE53475.1 OmpW family protein [Pandoraea terrae]
MKLKYLTIAALAMLTASGTALAQKAGDNVVNVGWFHFTPQDSSDPLQITGSTILPPAFQGAVNQRLQNSGARVDDADTAGLTFMHFFTDNISAEVVLGVAPKFNLTGTGALTAPDGQPLASATQWSPAVLVKYYFGQAADTWRPFVGLGASYFFYSNINIHSNLQAMAAQSLGGGQPTAFTTAKLKNSWAPVFNAGINYNIDKHWSMAFSVSYVPVSTTATLTTSLPNGAATVSQSKVRLNPVITFLSLGYTF